MKLFLVNALHSLASDGALYLVDKKPTYCHAVCACINWVRQKVKPTLLATLTVSPAPMQVAHKPSQYESRHCDFTVPEGLNMVNNADSIALCPKVYWSQAMLALNFWMPLCSSLVLS